RLGKPLAVTVTDAYGNPVPDRAIRFAARGGRVTPERVMTDARGRAETRWTLGARPGAQVLTAAITGTELRISDTVDARKPAAKR
ncbi:MAG: Ig-like domain-containing protein, partial [Gemmatimonadales bacterium]